jgi:hypothetical protein
MHAFATAITDSLPRKVAEVATCLHFVYLHEQEIRSHRPYFPDVSVERVCSVHHLTVKAPTGEHKTQLDNGKWPKWRNFGFTVMLSPRNDVFNNPVAVSRILPAKILLQ